MTALPESPRLAPEPAVHTARVRVFVPTHRRPVLLERALRSLLRQTVTNWICEVHNDAPGDSSPAQLVARLGDSRILNVEHERNLGARASFNLFYRPIAEPFMALLEDDAHWEPRFLETLLETLERHPTATMAWCNQAIDEETETGEVRQTGRRVNPERGQAERLFHWGESWVQVMGALHANGAMVLRVRPGVAYPTPDLPFGGVEAFRERLLPHPLVYVEQTLATFTVTRRTARSDEAGDWGALCALLARSYLRHATLPPEAMASLWRHYATQRPPATAPLMAAALGCREARPLLRLASVGEWLHFLLSALRHPVATCRLLRAAARFPDAASALDRATQQRFEERRAAVPTPPR